MSKELKVNSGETFTFRLNEIPDKMNRSQLWTLCCIAVLLMVFLIFTPLVIPAQQSTPFFLGMPYSMWVGLLVSFVLLALTIFGSWVHPGRDK